MKEEKTGEADAEPNAEMLKAMVKDPHKSKEDNPKKDMNAMYMKSDVRADVKNGGGADMAKVKDAPKMQTAMKKINAMYKTEKYLQTKDGSINDAVAQMQVNEMKTVTIRVKEFSQMVETYLARGGVKGFINAELTEGKQVLPLKEVRTFIDTYNRHFLTNYRAEEFIVRDRLNEAMMGNYKIDNNPMAGEFGFVSMKAMNDNEKKVGGNKGVQAMMKKGMSADAIAKKYGMYPDAVKMMAKGQSLESFNEAMMGNYKIENDPMAGEFGFVSKKAMDDNEKAVGGNKGVQAMMKKGMSADAIAKKYGMYPDAVKMMAKGQSL